MENQIKNLVSCLCITHNRVAFLDKAIQCFFRQSYAEKELIILHQKNDLETARFLQKFSNKTSIKIVVVDNEFTLGEKRNIAIASSSGEYFCQWDDDDWYHNDRIAIQLSQAIENGKDVSILAYKLMYDSVNKKAYLSNLGPWPNTILCNRRIFDDMTKYPAVDKGEDYDFMKQLYARNLMYPIIKPSLYIYNFHGNNTWEAYHFQDFFKQSQLLPNWISELIEDITRGAMTENAASKMLFSEVFLKELNYIPKI